jgi:Zn ribbon nucleic-acid-binding protein
VTAYLPCPGCAQDWGMGLMYRDGALAVECMDCGFRGPSDKGDPSAAQDRRVIGLWNSLPRNVAINWTPQMRMDAIMGNDD